MAFSFGSSAASGSAGGNAQAELGPELLEISTGVCHMRRLGLSFFSIANSWHRKLVSKALTATATFDFFRLLGPPMLSLPRRAPSSRLRPPRE